MQEPILLSAYRAKQCPVRVQNDFMPVVPTLKWVPSQQDQARLDAGIAFERSVFSALIQRQPAAVIVDPRLDKADAIAVTTRAMDSAAPLVLGGWLPDDVDGGRTGRPDILVRVDGGYLPADVKNHLTLKRAKISSALVSTLGAPDELLHATGLTAATVHRYEDGLQLAHYTRMLEACGYQSARKPWLGAVLGTTQLDMTEGRDPELAFVWHNLDEPIVSTFSRSRGKTRRSLLEWYDHEHAFRVKVAYNARTITGAQDDPPPLVEPVGQDECRRCPYDQWCADQMGKDDPSAAITVGRLDIREWLTLRRMGVTTTAALSALDPGDPVFFNEYRAEISHLSPDSARKRLLRAIQRAEMISDGIEIMRTGHGSVDVPVANIEIDVDIEYDIDNRVYMWGARLRRGTDDSSAQYFGDFVVWEPLDSRRERELAARFATWLREQRSAAESSGQTVKVFHWSHPESSRLRSILGLAEVSDLIDSEAGMFVDLEQVFKANFLSLHGSSLKKVAPRFGFTWRVDDPGGDVSQVYLSKVRNNASPDEMAMAMEWLLTYNEDDTAAMACIRDGMRSWVH